ncbi:MAG TPA: YdbL family protein [Sphingomicrobium sp.]|nr:YdbL family protein [Sphingomicrobium sp.]
MRGVSLLAVVLASAPAAAQPSLIGQAIEAGQAGERFDGYMGVAGPAPAALERQVRAINIRRRNLYIGLAARRNATPELVGMATGCQLLRALAPGEAYMLSDGVWRHRAPGQAVPLPDYCR